MQGVSFNFRVRVGLIEEIYPQVSLNSMFHVELSNSESELETGLQRLLVSR